MKSLQELTALYVRARNNAKTGDSQLIPLIIEDIKAVSNHCKELYFTVSVMDKVKCKRQYESLDAIAEIIQAFGLQDWRIQSFFGFAASSVDAPSFAEILGGQGIVTPIDTTQPKTTKTIKPSSPVENTSQTSSTKQPVSQPTEVGGKGQNSGTEHSQSPLFAPGCLADFIGQEHVVKRILSEIAAAHKQGLHYIDNILLFGNRGLGKTTLMKLIAKELGAKMELLDASHIGTGSGSKEAFHKFFQRICREGVPVVIGIDELHALPKSMQESLLTLLNDRVYIYMDKQGRTYSLEIPEFTFIGATTDSQDILVTIKDRCNNLTFYLKDYTRDELHQIFVNKFAAKGLSVTEEVLNACIDRCRSSIREVDSFVSGLKTKAINADVSQITLEMALEYFHDIDRDPIGLKSKDLEILTTILNEPVGVISEDTLAARVHLDAKVLTSEFEPYLLKIGFVNITSRGRALTQKAIDYLKGDGTITEQTPSSDGDESALTQETVNNDDDAIVIIADMVEKK